MFKLKCGPIAPSVYWVENIASSKAFPKGWIADVSLMAFHVSAIAGDAETVKSLAVVLARHLCQTNQVDIPECLNEPDWVSTDQ